MTVAGRLGMLAAGSALVIGLLGCGRPPGAGETPAPPPVSPGSSGTTAPTFPGSIPTGSPGRPSGGFAEEIATGCGGEPGEGELLEILQDEGLLDQDAEAEFAEGPLCSADWQWARIRVPDLDPLQVVTRGEPGDLELVSAGTDVCSVEVRVQAPPGIQGAASCQG